MTRRFDVLGMVRVPMYFASAKFRLPCVLPRSGQTRRNQTAGPCPFERARSLLQKSFNMFQLFRDPPTRKSSSGSARRRTNVGRNRTRVLSTLYLPKLVIRGRSLQSCDSTRQRVRRVPGPFNAQQFVQPEFGHRDFIPGTAPRKKQRRQARRAGAPSPETTTPLPHR